MLGKSRRRNIKYRDTPSESLKVNWKLRMRPYWTRFVIFITSSIFYWLAIIFLGNRNKSLVITRWRKNMPTARICSEAHVDKVGYAFCVNRVERKRVESFGMKKPGHDASIIISEARCIIHRDSVLRSWHNHFSSFSKVSHTLQNCILSFFTRLYSTPRRYHYSFSFFSAILSTHPFSKPLGLSRLQFHFSFHPTTKLETPFWYNNPDNDATT